MNPHTLSPYAPHGVRAKRVFTAAAPVYALPFAVALTSPSDDNPDSLIAPPSHVRSLSRFKCWVYCHCRHL